MNNGQSAGNIIKIVSSLLFILFNQNKNGRRANERGNYKYIYLYYYISKILNSIY